MSRGRGIVVLISLLALGGLLAAGALSTYEGNWFSGLPGIERSVENDTEQWLEDNGYDDAVVSVEGRDVALSFPAGIPDGVDPAALAASIEGEVDGLGSVSVDGAAIAPDGDADGATAEGDAEDTSGSDESAPDEDSVAEPTPDPTPTPVPAGGQVAVVYDGETVVLDGEVTTEQGRDALVRAAGQLVDADSIEDNLVVLDGDGSDLERVSVAAVTLRRIGEWYDEAVLVLDGNTFSLAGETTDPSSADQAAQIVEQLTQQVDLDATVTTELVDPSAADEADSAGDPDGDDADADDADQGAQTDTGADDDGGESDASDVVASLDLGEVGFEPGSAVLTPQALGALDVVAAQLGGVSGVVVEVQGHTATGGDPDVNLLLSDERAVAVRDYLVASGVNPQILTARGYGAARPMTDTTDADQTANERIELVVIEGNN